ncbi:MAG: hypothetical protein PHP25_01325 [Candidatus Moranbacteria bacterium]|nr:hypothetical protein [Candidatus Moranbacteria bacterium]
MSEKCNNKLTIYADEKDADRFQKITPDKGKQLWFGNFLLWRIRREEERIVCEFQSSSQPPIDWLKDISKHFPEALFKLEFESFMQYEGTAYVRNGKISICRDDNLDLQKLVAKIS